MSGARLFATIALLVVGAALLAVGLIYLTVAAPNLPSFVPGHVSHSRTAHHYSKRGIAAVVLAAAAFVGAYVVSRVPSHSRA